MRMKSGPLLFSLALVDCVHAVSTPTPAPAPATAPAPAPAVQVEVGCLPAALHGVLKERRGAWWLYANVSGDGLLLEHQGPTLRIREDEVTALRGRVDFGIVEGPIHGFGGPALCDITVRPSQGVCMMASILPGADPFVVTERLDRKLGSDGLAACYGVSVDVGEMARAF